MVCGRYLVVGYFDPYGLVVRSTEFPWGPSRACEGREFPSDEAELYRVSRRQFGLRLGFYELLLFGRTVACFFKTSIQYPPPYGTSDQLPQVLPLSSLKLQSRTESELLNTCSNKRAIVVFSTLARVQGLIPGTPKHAKQWPRYLLLWVYRPHTLWYVGGPGSTPSAFFLALRRQCSLALPNIHQTSLTALKVRLKATQRL